MQMNYMSSKARPVICGVPQGRMLVPLIFNIYLNDILHIFPTAKFITYTDDTSICFLAITFMSSQINVMMQ